TDRRCPAATGNGPCRRPAGSGTAIARRSRLSRDNHEAGFFCTETGSVKQTGSRDMALFWRVLALFCAVALAVLSLWPADELVRVGMGYINDKVGHFLA